MKTMLSFIWRRTFSKCSFNTSSHVYQSRHLFRAVQLEPVTKIRLLSSLPCEAARGTPLEGLTAVSTSVIGPCDEDLSDFGPQLAPSFNLAAYVNKSPMLQEMVKLGVDLHQWEKKKGIAKFVLRLDFERDMRAHLRFLHDIGIPASNLGPFLTTNPLIFKESVEDLQVRVNFLLSKRFSADAVARIAQLNPHWLMFSTARVERRLAHFGKTFELTESQLRRLAAKQPRLITYQMEHIKLLTFSIREQMGFTPEETKRLLLARPRLWMMDSTSLLARFTVLHNEMARPHAAIAAEPAALGCRAFRLRERHAFLRSLGLDRYDAPPPDRVSLTALVAGDDAHFCATVARQPIARFNDFLKTL